MSFTGTGPDRFENGRINTKAKSGAILFSTVVCLHEALCVAVIRACLNSFIPSHELWNCFPTFHFLFLKIKQIQLNSLCTHATCQPESNKVFKAPWWDNKNPWISSLLRNLTEQSMQQKCSRLIPNTPESTPEHLDALLYQNMHHLEIKFKLPLQMCWWLSQTYSPSLVRHLFTLWLSLWNENLMFPSVTTTRIIAKMKPNQTLFLSIKAIV